MKNTLGLITIATVLASCGPTDGPKTQAKETFEPVITTIGSSGLSGDSLNLAKITELELKIENLNIEIGHLNQSVGLLETENGKLTTEKSALQVSNTELTSKKNELNEKVAELEAAKTNLVGLLATANSQISIIKSEKDAAQTLASNLQGQLDTKNQQLTSKQNKINELTPKANEGERLLQVATLSSHGCQIFEDVNGKLVVTGARLAGGSPQHISCKRASSDSTLSVVTNSDDNSVTVEGKRNDGLNLEVVIFNNDLETIFVKIETSRNGKVSAELNRDLEITQLKETSSNDAPEVQIFNFRNEILALVDHADRELSL